MMRGLLPGRSSCVDLTVPRLCNGLDFGVAHLCGFRRVELETLFGTSHQLSFDLPVVLEFDFDHRAWSETVELQFHFGSPLCVLFDRGRESRSSGSSGEQQKYENPR
jgi:hypothetical protein